MEEKKPSYDFAPTARFSNRASDYAKYRPGYPDALVGFLKDDYGMSESAIIADIGAGTGLLSALLLRSGYKVKLVEPNREMLEEARRSLEAYSSAEYHEGSGEQSGLETGSVDLVTIAQAFHWMDVEQTRLECDRILSRDGKKLLVWNIQKEDTDFMRDFVQLKADYSIKQEVPVRINEENIRRFFSPATVDSFTAVYEQSLTLEGLKGQLLSSSYLPLPGDEAFGEFHAHVEELFHKYEEDGTVSMRFDTVIYYGR